MTNPTSNFGWQMPTSTDLVTDLPADFEVFGQAVDTDFVDLLGGTTGQVLSKTSATDMDFTWVTTDDANAIQNSIVNAKGDLIGASANDVPAILSVGTNGQTLMADNSTPTGLKWAAPSSGALTLVKRASFSAVASTTTTFDSVFSSTYSNYLIVAEGLYGSVANALIQFQWRVGAATQSATTWYCATAGYSSGGSLTTTLSSGDTLFKIAQVDNALNYSTAFNFTATNLTGSMPEIYGTYQETNRQNCGSGGGSYRTVITPDGFILSLASGNITGTVSVYGLAKS